MQPTQHTWQGVRSSVMSTQGDTDTLPLSVITVTGNNNTQHGLPISVKGGGGPSEDSCYHACFTWFLRPITQKNYAFPLTCHLKLWAGLFLHLQKSTILFRPLVGAAPAVNWLWWCPPELFCISMRWLHQKILQCSQLFRGAGCVRYGRFLNMEVPLASLFVKYDVLQFTMLPCEMISAWCKMSQFINTGAGALYNHQASSFCLSPRAGARSRTCSVPSPVGDHFTSHADWDSLTGHHICLAQVALTPLPPVYGYAVHILACTCLKCHVLLKPNPPCNGHGEETDCELTAQLCQTWFPQQLKWWAMGHVGLGHWLLTWNFCTQLLKDITKNLYLCYLSQVYPFSWCTWLYRT